LSVCYGKANVLFLVAVNRFKKKVSKKKAIAIFDLFLGAEKLWTSIGELDNKRESMVAMHSLKRVIEECRELRAEAQRMSAFRRLLTSGSRAIVVPGLFDPVITASNVLHDNGAVKGFLKQRSGTRPGLGDWQKRATEAKETLSEAGFDVAELGMSKV
jgi:hypothetical protein